MPSRLIQTAAVVALALASIGATAQQRPVNDTGVVSCTNEGWVPVTCESVNVTLPGQDAVFGRDALSVVGSLNKTGTGRRGFDMTKLGNDGVAVLATASFGDAAGQYRCVKDNTTGLVWNGTTAVKYWRDPNPATNGGFVGAETLGNTTDAYVSAENGASRCARTTWRLPTVRELLSIGSFENASKFVWGDESMLFPVNGAYLWSSQTNPAYPEHAFLVVIVQNTSPTPYPVVVEGRVDGRTNKNIGQYTLLVSSQ